MNRSKEVHKNETSCQGKLRQQLDATYKKCIKEPSSIIAVDDKDQIQGRIMTQLSYMLDVDLAML